MSHAWEFIVAAAIGFVAIVLAAIGLLLLTFGHALLGWILLAMAVALFVVAVLILVRIRADTEDITD